VQREKQSVQLHWFATMWRHNYMSFHPCSSMSSLNYMTSYSPYPLSVAGHHGHNLLSVSVSQSDIRVGPVYTAGHGTDRRITALLNTSYCKA